MLAPRHLKQPIRMAHKQVAIGFDHHDNLIDFVRRYGHPEAQGRYALLVCEGGGADDGPLYLLREDGPLPDDPEHGRQTIYRADGMAGIGGDLRRVVHVRRGDRLTAMVGAVGAPTCEAPETVVFWVENAAVLNRLVTRSLQLGCDRLQLATVTTGGSKATLLRAEQPSFFVVDEVLSDPLVTVFIPQASGQLYVPYGMTHPLIDLWRGHGLAGGEAFFFHGAGPAASISLVSSIHWEDVYSLLDYVVEGSDADERWQAITGLLPRFVIELHLAPAHKRREPQLWLLRAAERERLEQLLGVTADADLAALHFSGQRTSSGEELFLLRERLLGTGRQYLDFGGVELGPYAGYPNLFVPVDVELDPQLRRDRYREIFDLHAGELTLVWPGTEGRVRIVKVSDGSFKPLPELVDYIIGESAETLTALVARSVFTFERLSVAPTRPLRGDRVPSDKPERRADETSELASPREVRPAPSDPTPNASPAVAAPQAIVRSEPPSPRSGLERREAALEGQLITNGQTVSSWRALGEAKLAVGKHREALLSFREALWLCFAEGADRRPIAARLRDLLLGDSALDLRRAEALAVVPDAPVDAIWLYVVSGAELMEIEGPAGGQRRRWLATATEVLESRGSELPTKVRWMMWRALLSVSRDAIAEAKIRETLLDQLTDKGVSPDDVPTFIQDRIYQSRFLEHSDDDVDPESHHALALVEAIEADLGEASDGVLAQVGRAVLAYAFERLGAHERAVKAFDEAARFFSDTTVGAIDRAWIALYLGATAELEQAGLGQAWMDLATELASQHASGSLAHGELEVIRESILVRASADSPTEFFAPAKFRALFADSSRYRQASKIRDELEMLVSIGAFAQALGKLEELAERSAVGPSPLDVRQFAWLVGPVVAVLRRIGRVAEGVAILAKLDRASKHSSGRSMMVLYQTLFRIKIAEGYLELGEETRGVELLTKVLGAAWRSQDMALLDHLDMLGAALEAIEVAPVKRRSGPALEVLRGLFIAQPHPSDGPGYRPVKLRLIDHCVEVALSKEKLSLKRFKNYLDEDEFHVRNRLVNDTLSPDP